MSWLLADSPCQQGDEVAVLINGLGATPLEELYLMYRHVHQILAESQMRVFRVWIGEFATAMEMTGMSISLMPVDEELKTLLNAGPIPDVPPVSGLRREDDARYAESATAFYRVGAHHGGQQIGPDRAG